MDKIWLVDPVTNQKSVTLTFFSMGFSVALFKLVFSGMAIGALQMTQFSGTDFAAVVGALGGIYALRRMGSKDDQPG